MGPRRSCSLRLRTRRIRRNKTAIMPSKYAARYVENIDDREHSGRLNVLHSTEKILFIYLLFAMTRSTVRRFFLPSSCISIPLGRRSPSRDEILIYFSCSSLPEPIIHVIYIDDTLPLIIVFTREHQMELGCVYVI